MGVSSSDLITSKISAAWTVDVRYLFRYFQPVGMLLKENFVKFKFAFTFATTCGRTHRLHPLKNCGIYRYRTAQLRTVCHLQ